MCTERLILPKETVILLKCRQLATKEKPLKFLVLKIFFVNKIYRRIFFETINSALKIFKGTGHLNGGLNEVL